MKKILFILAFVYTAFSYGQGGPKVDAIKFKGDVTTTVRDAIDVPVGETWLIYNVTTDKVEFASSDDVWHDLTQLPLIDDNNLATATSTNVASASSVKNYVDFYAVKMFGGAAFNRSADFGISDTGTGVAGFSIDGGSDRAQISGGTVGSQVNLYVGSNGVYSLDQSNAVIDAFGDYAFTTKLYNDTNYISQDSIVDSDTFASVSPTTVPSSESVKAYVDASISGSGAVPDDTGSSNGDVLTTDGAGTYTWQTPTTGSSPPFDDTTSLVQDPVDGTKEMRIDVGAVSTATTRTLTMPDADVDLGNLGAANLDLAANFTWTGSHVFPSLTRVASILNLSDAAGGDIISYAAFTESDGTTTKGYVGYNSTLGVVLNNNTTSERLRLLDAGGGLLNADLTADSFIKSGATSDDVLLGNGTTTSLAGINTDDQTASEVNITDTGAYYTGTNVEAALQEIGADLASTVGDPDQTLSLGGTGNKDLTISGTGGNTIDLTGVDGVDADNIVSKGTARTSPIQYTDIYGQTQANYNTDGAAGAGELVIITDASPAEVVATATIAMDGWKMYDDQTADAATITLSDCDPGETLTVYINRASAPTLAGTGLTFNQLPNTTAFAAATTMAIEFRVAYDGTTIDYYYVER